MCSFSSVDGGYSSWNQWSTCSVSCGGGRRARSRTCDNPKPQHGGKDCLAIGLSTQSEECSTNDCPSNRLFNFTLIFTFFHLPAKHGRALMTADISKEKGLPTDTFHLVLQNCLGHTFWLISSRLFQFGYFSQVAIVLISAEFY